MSTIIQKQYETAKKLLALCEHNLKYWDTFGRTQKDFDTFYNNVTSLLTIIGDVSVCSKVIQEVTQGVKMIDYCLQRFAAYEAELRQAGLILSRWEQILLDVEATEPAEAIIYTDNEKFEMWAESERQNNNDYHSRR